MNQQVLMVLVCIFLAVINAISGNKQMATTYACTAMIMAFIKLGERK